MNYRLKNIKELRQIKEELYEEEVDRVRQGVGQVLPNYKLLGFLSRLEDILSSAHIYLNKNEELYKEIAKRDFVSTCAYLFSKNKSLLISQFFNDGCIPEDIVKFKDCYIDLHPDLFNGFNVGTSYLKGMLGDKKLQEIIDNQCEWYNLNTEEEFKEYLSKYDLDQYDTWVYR